MTPPTPQPPLTIFIVDDNPVDVGLIRWVLDAHALPYALHVIDNGDHALQVFDQLAAQEAQHSPTIVLLDLHLGSLVFPGVQNCGNINKLCRHVCVSKC